MICDEDRKRIAASLYELRVVIGRYREFSAIEETLDEVENDLIRAGALPEDVRCT